MQTNTFNNRFYTVALSCLVQCASIGLVHQSVAQAQDASPFERINSDGEGGWKYYPLEIPADTVALIVVLSGGTGDADLYVRRGDRPTADDFECAPFLGGNNETCTIANPRAGTWHVGIHAYNDYTDASLKATWNPAAPEGRRAPDWQEQILSKHNEYRALHCAPALTWDDEIAASAQAWADGCVFDHEGVANTGFGENLAGGFVGENAGAAVDMWYKEIESYNFSAPGFSLGTGHFTQVVWRGSTRIGCGVAKCPGSMFGWPAEFGDALMYSCRYAAPGNSGDYEGNVSPLPKDGVCE